jgi:hypothetical protein
MNYSKPKHMDYNIQHIESLLQKYWHGETSLNEEAALRRFFTEGSVPEHLKPYASIFAFFVEEQKKGTTGKAFTEKLLKNIENKEQAGATPLRVVSRRRQISPLLRIAASVVLIVGLFFVARLYNSNDQNSWASEDTYENPEEAYEAVEEALLLVSAKIKKGRRQAADEILRVRKATDLE